MNLANNEIATRPPPRRAGATDVDRFTVVYRWKMAFECAKLFADGLILVLIESEYASYDEKPIGEENEVLEKLRMIIDGFL